MCQIQVDTLWQSVVRIPLEDEIIPALDIIQIRFCVRKVAHSYVAVAVGKLFACIKVAQC